MSARDELAEAIDNNFEVDDYSPTFNEAGEITGSNVADAIRALGYRKPRTITTAEDAEPLAVGAAILADDGEVLMKSDDFAMDGIRPLWWRCGRGMSLTTLEPLHLPATVLHEGGSR